MGKTVMRRMVVVVVVYHTKRNWQWQLVVALDTANATGVVMAMTAMIDVLAMTVVMAMVVVTVEM